MVSVRRSRHKRLITVRRYSLVRHGRFRRMDCKTLPATLEGQLLLSGKPPLNIARYIKELKAYPYGCLEQTASWRSSLYTNAAQLQALGIKGDSDEKRRASVDIGISRLLQMQRDNGGFALWDKNGDEEYWLTAYVMISWSAQANRVTACRQTPLTGNERLLRD
ncbi:hypothetical protein ACLB1R_02280 [Escherichia coli]